MTPDSKFTPYGKFLKKIRVDRDETISRMAAKTGLSTSYLASIETGAREIPAGFSSKLIEAYRLTDSEISGLVAAECLTAHKTIGFSMEEIGDDPDRIQAAVYLTCMLPFLSKQEVQKMCGELKGFAQIKSADLDDAGIKSEDVLDQKYITLKQQTQMLQKQISDATQLYKRMKKAELKAKRLGIDISKEEK
jgi:HTH-type transcriptional regulator, competence development regulator